MDTEDNSTGNAHHDLTNDTNSRYPVEIDVIFSRRRSGLAPTVKGPSPSCQAQLQEQLQAQAAGSILTPRTPSPSGDRELASNAGRGPGCELAARKSVYRTSTMSKVNSGVAPTRRARKTNEKGVCGHVKMITLSVTRKPLDEHVVVQTHCNVRLFQHTCEQYGANLCCPHSQQNTQKSVRAQAVRGCEARVWLSARFTFTNHTGVPESKACEHAEASLRWPHWRK